MSNHFQPRPRPARSSSSLSAALPVATDLARCRRLPRAIAGGSMVSVTSSIHSCVLAFGFLSTRPGTLSTAATLSVFADTGTSTSTVSLNSQSTLNSAC